MGKETLLYIALSRLVREHESLTASRAKNGEPPALTNEAMHLGRKALYEYEAEISGFK